MRIYFTVTNDLSYDQRMQRICHTLAGQGHMVTLVGRHLPSSAPLDARNFDQKRLRCIFQKGMLFYAEYNLRLFFLLLFAPLDAVCSVDLDTLPAGCTATLLRRKKRVFDAHEYFTEVPELVNRPFVRSCWALVERVCLPFYRHAYTVGPALAGIFSQKYRATFGIVRNVPLRTSLSGKPGGLRILLYQGALNEGRGIEAMLEAMKQLEGIRLLLAGEGDLSAALRQQAEDLQLGDKVQFLGYIKPEALKGLTAEAWLGINLLENKGLSYYYSLANKYFDYVQAGVPVLTMNFPEYRALNAEFAVAELINDVKADTIAGAIRRLLENEAAYRMLQRQCLLAREEWNWEKEQKNLLLIWESVARAD
ncbi:MAG: glycosyltransferase [Saprospiraceae bacterium]|nr:glycosyltransferase [Saprospiraceae bacterium]